MPRAPHVTILAADPTVPVARLGAAADEVAVVTEPSGLSVDADSLLVVSGRVDPSLVGAAVALTWSAVALDLSTAADAATLSALGPLRPDDAQWVGDLPLLLLAPGGADALSLDVLAPVSRLLGDRRSPEDALGLEQLALEADRAEREELTAETARLEERARKAERGRRRAEAEVARLRSTTAVRAGAALGRVRRRVPGGTAGTLVLAGLTLVLLIAGVWLVASTGHAGLAVLGAAGLAFGAGTALLVVQESRHGQARVDEGAERTATALGELRRSQKAVRSRVSQLDAKHDDVVGRLGRIELMLAHRDPEPADPAVRD